MLVKQADNPLYIELGGTTPKFHHFTDCLRLQKENSAAALYVYCTFCPNLKIPYV